MFPNDRLESSIDDYDINDSTQSTKNEKKNTESNDLLFQTTIILRELAEENSLQAEISLFVKLMAMLDGSFFQYKFDNNLEQMELFLLHILYATDCNFAEIFLWSSRQWDFECMRFQHERRCLKCYNLISEDGILVNSDSICTHLFCKECRFLEFITNYETEPAKVDHFPRCVLKSCNKLMPVDVAFQVLLPVHQEKLAMLYNDRYFKNSKSAFKRCPHAECTDLIYLPIELMQNRNRIYSPVECSHKHLFCIGCGSRYNHDPIPCRKVFSSKILNQAFWLTKDFRYLGGVISGKCANCGWDIRPIAYENLRQERAVRSFFSEQHVDVCNQCGGVSIPAHLLNKLPSIAAKNAVLKVLEGHQNLPHNHADQKYFDQMLEMVQFLLNIIFMWPYAEINISTNDENQLMMFLFMWKKFLEEYLRILSVAHRKTYEELDLFHEQIAEVLVHQRQMLISMNGIIIPSELKIEQKMEKHISIHRSISQYIVEDFPEFLKVFRTPELNNELLQKLFKVTQQSAAMREILQGIDPLCAEISILKNYLTYPQFANFVKTHKVVMKSKEAFMAMIFYGEFSSKLAAQYILGDQQKFMNYCGVEADLLCVTCRNIINAAFVQRPTCGHLTYCDVCLRAKVFHEISNMGEMPTRRLLIKCKTNCPLKGFYRSVDILVICRESSIEWKKFLTAVIKKTYKNYIEWANAEKKLQIEEVLQEMKK